MYCVILFQGGKRVIMKQGDIVNVRFNHLISPLHESDTSVDKICIASNRDYWSNAR